MKKKDDYTNITFQRGSARTTLHCFLNTFFFKFYFHYEFLGIVLTFPFQF